MSKAEGLWLRQKYAVTERTSYIVAQYCSLPFAWQISH